jgi:hypothetical protein
MSNHEETMTQADQKLVLVLATSLKLSLVVAAQEALALALKEAKMPCFASS